MSTNAAYLLSIAGLLTARMCADHCTRVVVLDPDATELVESARAPDAMRNLPQHPRVMQYNAGHAFQAIYHYAMTRLFPGRVESELADADAFVGRADYNLSFGGVYISSVVDQLPVPARVMVGCTRACQETLLRRLVAQDKRIEFIDGTLTGFDVDPMDSSRLKGVSYRRTGGSRDVISLQGDLVVGSLHHSPYSQTSTDMSLKIAWALRTSDSRSCDASRRSRSQTPL
jgi:hypothetical protein